MIILPNDMIPQLLVLLLPLRVHLLSPFLTTHSSQLSEGKSKYQELAQTVTLPKYGPCWLSALAQLQSTCDKLSENTQARLALKFANCFLAQAGQKVYPCKEEEEISSCLENVDINAFTTYNNFYTHTQNMCHFLKSQEWQEMTHNTITRLSSSSAKVARELEESHQLQEEIVTGQQSSLEFQRQLVENSSYLSQAIEASKGSVKDMLEEFRTSTTEQKMMIFEVFDRVSRLQNLVVSEVSWLYTVVFYSTCLLVIYLVTATKRTADSRLWLFFILTVNFGLERLVIWWSLPVEGENAVMDLSEMVSQRIWMVRNMAIFISILVLAVMAARFKDYNLINNCLLEEIERQNLELKNSMENFQVANKMKSVKENIDTLDGYMVPLSKLLEEDTGFIGDEDEYSDESDDSFNSTMADRTFTPYELDEQFSTAAGSRVTTPTYNKDARDTIDLALEALNSSLVHSTPAKISPATKKLNSTSKPPITPSRYNLRSRNKSDLNNSLEETPETFAMMVKDQLGRSKRNFSKWKMAVRKQTDAYSDDD